jgi:hypothetical protein
MAKMQGKDLTKVLKKFTDAFSRGAIEKETAAGGFEPVSEPIRKDAIAKFKAATLAMEGTCTQNVLGVKVRDTNSGVRKKSPAKKGAAKKKSASRR